MTSPFEKPELGADPAVVLTWLQDELAQRWSASSNASSSVDTEVPALLRHAWKKTVALGFQVPRHLRALRFASASDDLRSDSELAAALNAGDATAAETVVARYGPRLYRFALRKLRRIEADAEEVFQEMCAALLRRGKEQGIRPEEGLSSLLYKILRGKIIDLERRKYRTQEIQLEEVAEPEEAATAFFTRFAKQVRMADFVATLEERCSPLEQEVIVLAAYGRTSPEIADVVGLAPAAVRQIKSRALKRIRAHIEAQS